MIEEFRRHPVSGTVVVISSERGKKLEQLRRKHPRDWTTKAKAGLISGEACPFEYGHEEKTPGEFRAYRTRDTHPNTPGWWVRVVRNLYPAVKPDIVTPGEPLEEVARGPFMTLPAFGHHYMIIESPEHNACLATVSQHQIREILHMWREMYAFVGACRNIKYVSLFENFGPLAGASQPHPHSQIVGLPIIPQRILNELRGARRFFDEHCRCFFCEEVEFELHAKSLIVAETSNFLAWCPFTAKTPYQFLIGPKCHQSSFGNISVYGRGDGIDPLTELAGLLQNIMQHLRLVLNDPDYNLYIHNGPTDEPELDTFHWHIHVEPITEAILAGFEKSNNTYINPRAPEDAAEDLRNAAIS